MTSTIYKIYCKDSEITEVYVGSTEDFHNRCINHNTRCHNENNDHYHLKVYKFIRSNGGMDNWIIEPIIECEEDTRYDAEVHYFKTLNSKLNTIYPRRTPKEYYLDNKEKILERQILYYWDNKEKILERQFLYQKNNKEKISKRSKIYYSNNKEKYQIDIQCECGSIVRTTELNRHCRSKKHIRYLETIE